MGKEKKEKLDFIGIAEIVSYLLYESNSNDVVKVNGLLDDWAEKEDFSNGVLGMVGLRVFIISIANILAQMPYEVTEEQIKDVLLKVSNRVIKDLKLSFNNEKDS